MTHPLLHACCGSFPTVPMRTDLLTGQLSFLQRRWARPLNTDFVFTKSAANVGIKTRLITDNYVIILPQLGGMMDEFFDGCIFIRGSGSDPWQETVTWSSLHSSRRPSRSLSFEQQFLVNVQAWESAGGPPYRRLFDEAGRALRQEITNERFIFWVDCFSTHEPWISPQQLDPKNLPDDEPISPPYGGTNGYAPHQLAALRMQYAKRIAAVDAAGLPFISVLQEAMKSGDVALAVLSDHGFLFGEYGLVGKLDSCPVLPPLYDLVAWLSPHFENRVDDNRLLQPSDFTNVFCELLGTSFPSAPTQNLPDRPQVIGRNSPEVPTITIATREGFALVFRDDLNTFPRWYAQSKLDASRAWEMQGEPTIPRGVIDSRQLRIILGQQPWVENFRSSVNQLIGAT